MNAPFPFPRTAHLERDLDPEYPHVTNIYSEKTLCSENFTYALFFRMATHY